MRKKVMPGQRKVCTVTMKFNPVRMEAKPMKNTPTTMLTTAEPVWME